MMSTFSLILNHLFRGSSVGAKYFIQQAQNSPAFFWTLLSKCLELTLDSCSGWGGGLCCPIRMLFDVMGGSSQTSSELG